MKYDEDSLGALLGIAAIIIAPFFYQYKSCEWRWEDSAYEYRWELPGGCKIRTNDNKWVPDKNILASPAIKKEMIEMLAPNGKVYLIPSDDVSEATKAGGVIVDGKRNMNDPLGIRPAE